MSTGPPPADHLRPLAEAVALQSADGVASFTLSAANEHGALLEFASWMRAPAPGKRLALVGRDGFLRAVRIQLTVVEHVDEHSVIAEWFSISVTHRAAYLTKVLEHVLGIRERVGAGVDVLAPGSELVWDAARRSVRLLGGDREPAAPERPTAPISGGPSSEGYYASSEDLERMRIRATGDAQPFLEISQRKASRLHPVFDRPPERGFYVVGEEDFFPVVVTAIGSAHCIFEVLESHAPTHGTRVRLGVPMEPLRAGLVWVPAKVSQVSGRPPRGRVEGARAVVEVQVDRTSGAIPVEFRQVVAHFRQQRTQKPV